MKLLSIISLLVLPTVATAQSNDQSVKQITHVVDGYPMLSPDGKTIAFHSNRTGNNEIYLMNPDGTYLRQLTNTTTNDDCPVWSPDGKKIVFTSLRDDPDGDIFIMDVDGKNVKRLTFTAGDDSHPKFSPDGQRVIFCSARNTPDLKADWSKQFIELFTIKTDGSDVKQISDFKTVTTYPSISPDGTKVLYRKVISTPGFNWDLSTGKRNSEVFVMNMDGTGERNLSDNSAFDGWPAWTPDGKVVFCSNRGGIPAKGQLYLINTDGTGLRRLTDPRHSFVQPSITTDGKYIYCQDNVDMNEFEFGGIAQLEFKK